MSRRIEVELTSTREDGTWTWRAAGAKQPKGVLSGSLLYDGAATGDVCKVDAEFLLDGIEIIEVFPPKTKKERVEILEMKPREIRDDELVTETRAPKGGGRGGRDSRDDRGGRTRRDGGGGRNEGRGERPNREGRGPRRPEPELRPKPKRLRAKHVHRDAVLAEVPDELRPIAEQVAKGGMQAVRAAIEKQNAEAKEAGTPEIVADPVLKIAEDLLPKLKTAEWRDRADAAIGELAELDLRDLRSVVVASDVARDDEGKAIAEQLRTGLNERIESDHQQWLADIQEAVDGGRSVRALRLSSRPVKAGAPLPPELASKLTAMANEGLSTDGGQDRWATVIDAVAYSPIRNAVVPAGYPTEPSKELLEAVRRVADRVPTIAAHFGIDPSEASKAKRRRPAKKAGSKSSESRADGDKGRKKPAGSKSEGSKSEGSRSEGAKKKPLPPVPGAEKKPEPVETDSDSAPDAEVAVGTEPVVEAAAEPETVAETAAEPETVAKAAAEPETVAKAAAEPEAAASAEIATEEG